MERRSPITWLLVGTGLGAASMYLFDPQRGTRRRDRLTGRIRGAVSDVEDLAGKARRDAENRAQGLVARVRGAPAGRRRRGMLSQGTPERRLLEGGGGALLALWGLVRGGVVGSGAAVAGVSLIANAAMPRANGIIRVQKTLTIAAPIDEVYELWSHFENFPRFMEHVIEVRAEDENRSHWRVAGPAGIPLEWDAELTEQVPNHTIAWRSLEGSVVDHHGEVHFEPIEDHSTRISVHMAYRPPAGAVGHTVASFLHGDPKTLMDDDLLRMKSLLEQGKTTAHHQEVTREQVQ